MDLYELNTNIHCQTNYTNTIRHCQTFLIGPTWLWLVKVARVICPNYQLPLSIIQITLIAGNLHFPVQSKPTSDPMRGLK